MQTYIRAITEWASTHNSTTLPNWLKRHPDIQKWIFEQTDQYPNIQKVNERVYIVLYGPPPFCEFGNKRKFNTFDLGYRKGCVLGNKCQCVSNLRMQNQKLTLLEKYGVESVSHIPGIEEKRKITNIQKFGTEWPAQSQRVKNKAKQNIDDLTAEQKESKKKEKVKKSKETIKNRYGDKKQIIVDNKPTNHQAVFDAAVSSSGFLDNKYTKWYFNIIKHSKNNCTNAVTETHHIIPECFFINRSRKGPSGWLEGNPEDKSNKVKLTTREHLICHVLLCKMTTAQAKYKMLLAFDYLNNRSDKRLNTKNFSRIARRKTISIVWRK